jgi:hypothetical protein
MARRAWGQALAVLAQLVPAEGEGKEWDEAEAQLAESLRLFESGEARLEAARTHVAWGDACRERGDLTAAQTHWEQAAAQWEASGLEDELARTRARMAQVRCTSRSPWSGVRYVREGLCPCLTERSVHFLESCIEVFSQVQPLCL